MGKKELIRVSVRDVDGDLWKQLRIRAIEEDVKFNVFFEKIIKLGLEAERGGK